MIPVHGWAVAVGDMVDSHSVASNSFDAITRWLIRIGCSIPDAMSRDTICAIWRTRAARDGARLVEVTISHNRPPARAVRAIAVEQPEVEEGEYR